MVSIEAGLATMRIVIASTSILSQVTSGNSVATSAAISSQRTIPWRWAIKEGDTWATSAVAGVGDSPPDSVELAAAIGPDGVARIAYVDGAADELVVGTRLGSSWSLTPITTAGHNLALAVGQDNRPQLILVQDGRLVYWTQQGGAWQSDPISPAGAAIFNAYLALDGQNRPHVVYTADGVVTAAVRQGEGDWEAERSSMPGSDTSTGSDR